MWRSGNVVDVFGVVVSVIPAKGELTPLYNTIQLEYKYCKTIDWKTILCEETSRGCRALVLDWLRSDGGRC